MTILRIIKNVSDMTDFIRKIADGIGNSFAGLIFPNIEIIENMVSKNVFYGTGRKIPLKLFEPRKNLFLDFGSEGEISERD